MKKIILIILAIVLLLSSTVSSYENIVELESRVSRKTTNTFYSGEDPVNYYIWQPQTVVYQDTSTGHEVMMWGSLADADTMGGGRWPVTEWPWMLWSADGKRFAFHVDADTAAFSRSGRYIWFVSRSDGSYWRPFEDGHARCLSTSDRYFMWSPAEPDVSYNIGTALCGRSGDRNAVYKNTITDTSVSYEQWVDILPGDTSTDMLQGMKRPITDDGKYMMVARGSGPGMRDTENRAESELFYIVQLMPDGSNVVNWLLPDVDSYWGSTLDPASPYYGHLHDQRFVGSGDPPGNYWFYFFWSGLGAKWRTRPWGTDGSRPGHTIDHSAPYDWYDLTNVITDNTEVQNFGYNAEPHPWPGMSPGLGHWSADPWGRYIVASDGDCYCGGSWGIGQTVIDLDNPNIQYTGCYKSGAANYASWAAWTDWPTASSGTNVVLLLYDGGPTEHYNAFDTHASISSGYAYTGLSPDGTKVVTHTDWLNPSQYTSDVLIGTVRFPHPPELTDVKASGGTVIVTFDWNLDGTTRGYTERGWPDEYGTPGVDADYPPPPRETERFRLWRSVDEANWIPVGTVDADIFSRYDFSNGNWPGDDYWQIRDNPGDGTWYYAVTSLEWSGLESRTLSNIYMIAISGGSGTGSQSSPYPSSPGDTDNPEESDFYTTAPSAPSNVFYKHQQPPASALGQYLIEWGEPADNSLIRYYNIYAEDGSEPTADQTNRIASIPKNSCNGGSCSWVDWLGKQDGSTQYMVTSVDYQGNEGVETGAPAVCNNNIIEGSEACDGTDLAGQTCISLGFAGGTLVCLPDCSDFNTSQCTLPPECNDQDGDGWGDPVSPTCTYPELDCDDNNSSINPGATETCGDGTDYDCDGQDSNGYSLGSPCGYGNLALSKTVTASNEFYFPASYMVDGTWDSQGQYWAALGSPNWAVIDLGQDYDITRINVGPYGNNGPYYYVNTWNIRYAISSQPTNWLDFTNVNKLDGSGSLTGPGIGITNGDPGHTNPDDDYKYYEFSFDTVNARYINYTVIQGDGDSDSNCDELELYGPEQGTIVCDGPYSTKCQTCHPADTNDDGCIVMNELMDFIGRWKLSSTDVPMPHLMEAIGLWKAGTECSG